MIKKIEWNVRKANKLNSFDPVNIEILLIFYISVMNKFNWI